MPDMTSRRPPPPASPQTVPRAWRHGLWVVLGWCCVGLGAIGAVLPVLPTTPFLLVALWAFSHSSPRFHTWLLRHRWLGRYIQDWERHRVIPRRAKIIALSTMVLSLAWAISISTAPWYALAIMAAVMAYGAFYILRKPSRPPEP